MTSSLSEGLSPLPPLMVEKKRVVRKRPRSASLDQLQLMNHPEPHPHPQADLGGELAAIQDADAGSHPIHGDCGDGREDGEGKGDGEDLADDDENEDEDEDDHPPVVKKPAARARKEKAAQSGAFFCFLKNTLEVLGLQKNETQTDTQKVSGTPWDNLKTLCWKGSGTEGSLPLVRWS